MKPTSATSCGAIALFLAATALQAQTAPAFEVASIKPDHSGGGVKGGCHGIDSHYTPGEAASAPPLGRCVITSGRLSHLISIAYGLRSMADLSGGASWVAGGDERFVVEAKAEDPTRTTEDQLLHMLQTLLVERFELKFHRENVDQQGFALMVGKNGPKLKPTKSADSQTQFGGGIFKPSPGQPIALTARKYSMSTLAEMLSFATQNPVVDRTGLTGEYDFTLSWDDNAGPALSTALRDQLGLRLEPQKVPVSRFVIDSARRPSEN